MNTPATSPSFPLIQSDVELQGRNTLALPCKAAFFTELTHPEQLPHLRTAPEIARRQRFVLGGGSNLVLPREFPGLVIAVALKGRTLAGSDDAAHFVTAAAGENWHDFVLWTLENGMPGLENLLLIPGSVGAAPIQNIGAYGLEVGDMFEALDAYDFLAGKMRRFTAKECAFGYRESLFKREGWHLEGRFLITAVTFRIPKKWQPRPGYGDLMAELAQCGIATPTPEQIAEAVMRLRRQKLPDPAHLPNAGSFFQNPVVSAEFAAALGKAHPGLPRYPQADGQVKLAAGWLIEQAGWKGRNLGPVGMYERQALILVNRGGATQEEVRVLSRVIREAVLARFGINLIPEPVFCVLRTAICPDDSPKNPG
ncbi:MAG: UDP-N-acetylmuramate dehydrogenase [Zoogloeaceae bacterium]|jgi:UDP-N-acetylmuramate dehydrogenase|nr:UDP-N-acetylmuramate dehydrogenase [Zoogloeaceae bacterium]